MATKRSLISVRFIRADAAFLSLSALTCLRWHRANGELETISVSRSCQLLPPPGRAGRKAIRTLYQRNLNGPQKTYVNTEFLIAQASAQTANCLDAHLSMAHNDYLADVFDLVEPDFAFESLITLGPTTLTG